MVVPSIKQIFQRKRSPGNGLYEDVAFERHSLPAYYGMCDAYFEIIDSLKSL